MWNFLPRYLPTDALDCTDVIPGTDSLISVALHLTYFQIKLIIAEKADHKGADSTQGSVLSVTKNFR